MFPFTRVPFWVPIFDPQPCQAGPLEAGIKNGGRLPKGVASPTSKPRCATRRRPFVRQGSTDTIRGASATELLPIFEAQCEKFIKTKCETAKPNVISNQISL